MSKPADRVQIQKQESTALGGDDADAVEWNDTPLDPREDAPEVQGVYFQPPTGFGAKDENCYLVRDTLGNLSYRDPNLDYERKTIDWLLHNDPDGDYSNMGIEYTPTYSANKVTKEEWKRNDTDELIKTIDYTYTGNFIDTEVRKVFAPDGTTVVAQITMTYSYAGSAIANIATARDV